MVLFCRIIFFIVSLSCYSQSYVSFSVDVNKVFNIIDNSRTLTDWKGLDYDLEIGVIDNNVSVYLFYGAFNNAYYSNYGAGVDLVLNPFKSLYLSIGNYYSKTMRHGKYKYLGGGVSFINPRSKITYYINNNIGLELISKYQHRAELDKRILVVHVREFIKKLKEEIMSAFDNKADGLLLHQRIDKLAGEKLI